MPSCLNNFCLCHPAHVCKFILLSFYFFFSNRDENRTRLVMICSIFPDQTFLSSASKDYFFFMFRGQTTILVLHALLHIVAPAQWIYHGNFQSIFKGQLISKWFLESLISSKKRTKTIRIVVKTNSFVRFLEEIDDSKNHFEIN